ncbi:MAG: hypothetical protein ACI87V_000387 [Flavobacteriales bacterium]|jgi:hypothetical protein
MKIYVTTALLIMSVVSFAQGVKTNLEKEDYLSKELIILNMDALFSQVDSMKLDDKWMGKGIQFQSDSAAVEFGENEALFVASFALDSMTQCFALFELNERTQKFLEEGEMSVSFIDVNTVQYILIDKDLCGKALEPTLVLALCDMLILGVNLKNMEQVVARKQHNEWLKDKDAVFMNLNDISMVARYQSEIQKMGVHNVKFINDDTDFAAYNMSATQNVVLVDRRVVVLKGQNYILTYFFQIGEGLSFAVSEIEEQRSTALIGRPYFNFLYQDGPIKPDTPLSQQNLKFKVPKRQ